jgi:hypothetical protein
MKEEYRKAGSEVKRNSAHVVLCADISAGLDVGV